MWISYLTSEQECEWNNVLKEEFMKYCVFVLFSVGSLITLCMYIAILNQTKKLRSKVGTNTDKRQQKQLKINKMMGTGWLLIYNNYIYHFNVIVRLRGTMIYSS